MRRPTTPRSSRTPASICTESGAYSATAQWVLLANPARVRRGELVRVDLYMSLPTARNFVVVDDPVPGGLEPVNRDLANASLVDAAAGDFQAAGGAYWFRFD